MTKEEVRENNRQWAFRIREWRDSEKYRLDKMQADATEWQWQRGRWSVLCDLLKSEFTDDLIKSLY